MKQILISALILLVLSSCSSAAPAPTATALPASANAPIPTPTPIATPTLAPIPTETLADQAKLEVSKIPQMTEKYMGQFESFEKGKKDVNGVETNIWYGINSKGEKKVIAMDMEIDGLLQMTRVGETVLQTKDGPKSIYVFMNPKFDASGRLYVNDKTADKLFGIPESPKYANLWNSLAVNLGIADVDGAIDFVMNDKNGIIKFNVAYGGRKESKDRSSTKALPYPANLNLPIEFMTIATMDEYTRLIEGELVGEDVFPKNIKEIIVHTEWGMDNPDETIHGALLWTKPNGQIVIMTISTVPDHYGYGDPDKVADFSENEVTRFYDDQFGTKAAEVVHLINGQGKNVDQFTRVATGLFEIHGKDFKTDN